MTPDEEIITKLWCEAHLLNFTRYMYKENNRRNFIVAPHFILMANKLMEVISGKINRLIINIPPRYGKTELAVKNFIAYGLAINPQSKFIHLSYSDDLALDNSSITKEYIENITKHKFSELEDTELKNWNHYED